MCKDTPEDERTKLISCLGAFRQYWGTLPQVYKPTDTHMNCSMLDIIFMLHTHINIHKRHLFFEDLIYCFQPAGGTNALLSLKDR